MSVAGTHRQLIELLLSRQRVCAPLPAFGGPGLPLAALPDTDGILAPHSHNLIGKPRRRCPAGRSSGMHPTYLIPFGLAGAMSMRISSTSPHFHLDKCERSVILAGLVAQDPPAPGIASA